MRLEFLKEGDCRVFLVSGAISAGTPKEITGEIMRVSLTDFLTGGRADGTFILQVFGDSMSPDIENGDVILVDQKIQAQTGDKIVACVRGEYTLKTFRNSTCGGGLRLVASNGKYPTREITRRDDFEIFGVVTHVIKKI